MRNGLCLILILSGVSWASPPPWSGQTDYRVRLETRLQGDRWRGFRRDPIDRSELRQRLHLDAYGLVQTDAVRLDLFLDTEVGSDLGPTPNELTVVGRERVVLDLYGAELVGRAGGLTARLGRHVLLDVLGFDALDGLSLHADVATWLAVEATAGLASRRGWSGFGPDSYAIDGLSSTSSAATVLGLGVTLTPTDWVELSTSWRRREGVELQQDTVGSAVHLALWDGLDLNGGARLDLMRLEWSELWSDLNFRVGRWESLLGWRRSRPVFDADSIWWAFGPEAHQAYLAGMGVEFGSWRLKTRGEIRRFVDGADAVDWAQGLDAGLSRSFGHRGAEMGLHGRWGAGFGGARHYADLFGRFPWFWRVGDAPVWLRWRLGAVYFDDVDRNDRDGVSGWGLLSARWAASQGVALETLVEGHVNGHDPYRLRVMTQLTAESWW